MGVSRDYASKQIAAAQVSTMVETPTLSERQARELAPLAKRATPEVVKQDYEEAVKQVQLWRGHHSPAFTLATYVHLLPDDMPDVTFLDAVTDEKASAEQVDQEIAA